MDGFVTLLKPPGITSNSAILQVRKLIPRGTKIGHAGTLDPEAAGILPIMIGKATRLFDYTAEKRKTYIAELVLGIETDTQDTTGTVIKQANMQVSQSQLEAALQSFVGEISQIPPMVSAIKQGGRRLYDLARAGIEVEREARLIQIFSIRILKMKPCLLEVTCGKGTYIRTLCHDIGRALHGCACMGMLLRTQTGPFSLESACTLEEVRRDGVEEHLLPMDFPLQAMPALHFGKEAEQMIRNGMPLPVNPEMEQLSDGPMRICLEDRFCGIGRLRNGRIRFDCNLWGQQ